MIPSADFDYGVDWLRLLRACCATEAREAADQYRQAMSQPQPAPRTPMDIALERCRQAGVVIPEHTHDLR